MDRPRILYYLFSYGDVSFIQSQIHSIAKETEVHVVCNRMVTDNNAEGLVKKERITVIPFGDPAWLFSIRNRLEMSDIAFNYYNRAFSSKLSELIHKINPDIIHCQFGHDALIFDQNFKSRGRKIAVSFRGYDASLKLILKTYRKRLQTFLSNPNVYSIFVSNSLRKNLLDHGIRFNEPSRVIYSNIDTDFFKRVSHTHKRDPVVFAQVSNFREKKGHVYTLMAFEKLLEEDPNFDFKLFLIGSIDQNAKRLMDRFKQSPVYSKIVLTGRMSSAEIKDVLERSHAAVHNSITSRFNDQEGIPNSIMEAMSMELPVVATRHGGIVELDDGRVDLFLSEEKNIDEYVENIRRAVKFGAYSQKNRARVVTSFSSIRFVHEIMEFYNEVRSV